MKSYKLAGDQILYFFLNPEKTFSTNISVLRCPAGIILIDVGYEQHVQRVLQDLEISLDSIKMAILTHKHEDHISGVKNLAGVPLAAGSSFDRDQQSHLLSDALLNNLSPDLAFTDKQTIQFGPHHLEVLHTPGHAQSGISVIVNEKTVFVGDLIIQSVKSQLELPYMDENSTPIALLNSLKKIMARNPETVVPGHGLPIRGTNRIQSIMESYIAYLERLQIEQDGFSFEDARIGPLHGAKIDHFHKANLQRVKIEAPAKSK